MNALNGLGFLDTSHVLLSYALTRARPAPDEESFENWVSNRFGGKLYRMFFKTYTEKVWGVRAAEIEAEWAAQRIRNLDLFGAVRDAVFGKARRNGQAITSLIEQFHYPRLGPGQMWERLAERVTAAGVPVHPSTRVIRVRHDGRRATAVSLMGWKAGEPEIPVSGVLSSMPLDELIRALDPPAPPRVLAAAGALRHRDLITVNLILKNPDLFPDNWIYVHSPRVKMGRIQNFKNWSPDLVPAPETTSLGLEYFCFHTDSLWSLPDARLVDLGMEELAVLGLARRDELLDGFVVRQRKTYPLYDGSYRANLEVLQEYLDRFENLFTMGRNGLHRYNNQDHSMITALLAVRSLAGRRHDLWAVNTEPEYHEEIR
jgi:protoporphyrinogen oxidase